MRVEGLAGKVAEDGNLAFLGICMVHQTRYQIRTNNALCQKEAVIGRNSGRSQSSTSRSITPSTILQRTVPTLLVVSPWHRDSLEQSTFYFLTLVSSVINTDLVILNLQSLQ